MYGAKDAVDVVFAANIKLPEYGLRVGFAYILPPLKVVNDNILLPLVVRNCPLVPSVVGYVSPCNCRLEPVIDIP